MAKNEDTQFRAQAQSQDLTERLSIARDAAMQASTLVGQLVRLASHPGDNECARIQAILPRLVTLTRVGMMAGHPDVTLDQLRGWSAGE
jgi:hypothetical protein